MEVRQIPTPFVLRCGWASCCVAHHHKWQWDKRNSTKVYGTLQQLLKLSQKIKKMVVCETTELSWVTTHKFTVSYILLKLLPFDLEWGCSWVKFEVSPLIVEDDPMLCGCFNGNVALKKRSSMWFTKSSSLWHRAILFGFNLFLVI